MYNICMKLKLSTGKTTIKRLSLFALDTLSPPAIEPLTYNMKMADGSSKEVEYDITTFDTATTKPDVPEDEIVENSPEYFQLYDWQLHQAALLHEKRRQEATEIYYERVANYILTNCIDDPSMIVTQQDWIKVYDASLVEQLTMEKISETLHKTYGATFQGESLFDALSSLSKGSGEYNTIRLWENKLMVSMGMTEVEYSLIPLDERARKICSVFIDDIMSALEMEKSRKENEAKK